MKNKSIFISFSMTSDPTLEMYSPVEGLVPSILILKTLFHSKT